jgi:hypothetical protein
MLNIFPDWLQTMDPSTSYLCLPCSWNNRCVPPSLALLLEIFLKVRNYI